ncbi:hypothetical protein FRAHR75_120027 [Frankia sp. Hr75.2]|nr:hypothetical protein FRAHR75_120027 [Frankia sp. Hr75.2]
MFHRRTPTVSRADPTPGCFQKVDCVFPPAHRRATRIVIKWTFRAEWDIAELSFTHEGAPGQTAIQSVIA